MMRESTLLHNIKTLSYTLDKNYLYYVMLTPSLNSIPRPISFMSVPLYCDTTLEIFDCRTEEI